jgi:hypothetical protein
MASTNRGGMKQSDKNNPSGSKKHQGVRPGSTATRKERHQAENRKPAFDESAAVNPERQPAKRKKGPAAKKLKDQPPEKRGEIKAGTGKKNLYANMPKARKVR